MQKLITEHNYLEIWRWGEGAVAEVGENSLNVWVELIFSLVLPNLLKKKKL